MAWFNWFFGISLNILSLNLHFLKVQGFVQGSSIKTVVSHYKLVNSVDNSIKLKLKETKVDTLKDPNCSQYYSTIKSESCSINLWNVLPQFLCEIKFFHAVYNTND